MLAQAACRTLPAGPSPAGRSPLGRACGASHAACASQLAPRPGGQANGSLNHRWRERERQWQQQRHGRRQAVVLAAASGWPASSRKELQPLRPGGSKEKLPVFLLPMVAMPSCEMDLNIYEARYRVLFSTLLAGEPGVEEGLVNTEKPWCGSRRFGLSFYDPSTGGIAEVGTVLEITNHMNIPDGRILIHNMGRQRYRIKEVVEERPFMVAEVEYFPDADEGADGPEARALAKEVADLYRSIVDLSLKMKNADVPQEYRDPPELRSLDPAGVSFWVLGIFGKQPMQQQAFLEEPTTVGRLQKLQQIFSDSAKQMSAEWALRSAFKTSGGGGSDVAPPAGGPD